MMGGWRIKKVVVYAILMMMFVNMIPVNIFADSKVVNVKVLTDGEMGNIIGAGNNNGGGYTGYKYYSIVNDSSKKIIRIDMPSGTRRDKLEVLAPRYVKINY